MANGVKIHYVFSFMNSELEEWLSFYDGHFLKLSVAYVTSQYMLSI